ncbi:DMT family transporter [Ascidiimonas sp. W6]|uniref:DMT family transporter n=1 Tax=Ascidiimonas meishanensis TaxID=3128903 RepID=UPI0030EDECA3
MQVSPYVRHLVLLNLSMLFISTSGVLGRYIALPPPLTIFCRALLALFFLFFYCYFTKINLFQRLGKDTKTIFFSGIFMGVHWITYFYALKFSNVAIGMLSIFTYPVITIFLEPILLKTTFQKNQLFLAILVVVGIFFLVPEFSFDNRYTLAVFLGVISAFFYALRNILVKKQIGKYQATALMWYQLLIIVLMLIPTLFLFPLDGIADQLPALAILALLTTAVGHSLYVMSFRYFSVSTASIMGSLQPLYGIILGFVFLREYPTPSTIIGGILILTSVVLEGVRSYK